MSDDLTTDAVPSEPVEENIKKEENQENVYEELPKSPKYKTSPKPRPTKRDNKQPKIQTVNNFHINAGKVHFGNKINIYGDKEINKTKQQSQPNKPNIVKTEKISRLLVSEVPATEKELSFVSKQLDAQWKHSIRALLQASEESKEDPFSAISPQARIDQYYQSHIHNGVSEVIYQLLLDWKQDQSDKATIGKLAKALWKNEQKPAVQKLAEICS